MTTSAAKPERAKLVDREQIKTYIDTLFGQLRFKGNHFVNVRGIGEKGTEREGLFQEDCWSQPGSAGDGVDGDEMLVSDVRSWAWTWAQHNVATYIVPGALNQARGKSESVELFPAVLVDLDTGDTIAKGRYLREHLGQPTMMVKSGGTTAEGTPKLHLYWVFETPSADVELVVNLRHEIAAKAGGDLQFGRGVASNPLGRAHQPIRIPGTVHSKNDVPHLVELSSSIGPLVELDILAESVRRMPASEWAITSAPSAGPATGFDFGSDKHTGVSRAQQALTTEVHEGGGEDATRWGNFNLVAGLQLKEVRQGKQTMAEASNNIRGYVLSKMDPPWPEARVDKEFRALVNVDERKSGPMPALAREEAAGSIVSNTALGLAQYATYRWTEGDPPARKFLVDGLVLGGKPHLLVAEGGAGKTFAMLDLCLKLSQGEWEQGARREGETTDDPFNGRRTDGETWMGMPIKAAPGTVVMLTTEDDQDELHIRLHGIDPEGKRFKAGNRLIVVPAVSTPRGPFTFGERDRVTGNVTPSPGWAEFKGWLEAIADLRLVVIDTLNTTLHGEENSATVINEYSKLLAPVCGKMGAALIVTHHIRKQDPKFPIKSKGDMAMAVRGSSALPAAFRAVLGIWHAHNYGGLLQALGETPEAGKLWRMAVLKANNPQMMDATQYLLRTGEGGLRDVSDRVRSSLSSDKAQRKAWLLAAVRGASEAEAPYRHASKDSPFGLYQRRNELHPMLREGARTRLVEDVDKLVDAGELVVKQIEWRDNKGRFKTFPTLDVSAGRYDTAQPERCEDGVVWKSPNWERDWSFNGGTGDAGPTKQRFVMSGMDG